MITPIRPKRRESQTPFWRPQMAKTIALFFVLGLMVSCASYRNERGISSVDQEEHQKHKFVERPSIGNRY